MKLSIPGFTLGIVGGGQLGRMMALDARRMGIRTAVLDPAPDAPAAEIAETFIVGSLGDPAALRQLALESDLLTFEIEHINARALGQLESGGVQIYPRPNTLALIQDKLHQKEHFSAHSIPVPDYWSLSADEVPGWQPPHYPLVQKARRGGYDGRGVHVLRGPQDLTGVLHTDSLVEELVDIDKELSVVVARGRDGEVCVYSVVEMVFDDRAQICSSTLAPARITPAQQAEALRMASVAVGSLDGIGVFAVEMFLTREGKILLNEVAPRPHNSGHWTMEGAVTSQFEQHIRAVCGLPLGSAELIRPSVMINLLGEPGAEGSPVLDGVEEALRIPGASLHWYQKTRVAPFRKMGHITVCASNTDLALARAEEARILLHVRGSVS